MIKKINEVIWAFIRGDMKTSKFEDWIYKHDHLKDFFGTEFYLELISSDYQSKEQNYIIKHKLEETLRNKFPLSCECISIANTDISDMGNERDEKIFSSLKIIKNHGDLLWWLSLYQCSKCKQYWLIAQEERQNDIMCFKRLNYEEANNIMENNVWPSYFQTYEELLQLGRIHGRSVRFLDPEGSSSLTYTIVDLAKQRPGISIIEIALLLDLEKDIAYKLCQKAIEKNNVIINLN